MSPRRVGSTWQEAPAWPTAAASLDRNFQVFSAIRFDLPPRKRKPATRSAAARQLHVAAFYFAPTPGSTTTRIETSRWHVGPGIPCGPHVRVPSVQAVREARGGVSHVRRGAARQVSSRLRVRMEGLAYNALTPTATAGLLPPKIQFRPRHRRRWRRGGGGAWRFQKLFERPRRSGEGPKQADPNRDASRILSNDRTPARVTPPGTLRGQCFPCPLIFLRSKQLSRIDEEI